MSYRRDGTSIASSSSSFGRSTFASNMEPFTVTPTPQQHVNRRSLSGGGGGNSSNNSASPATMLSDAVRHVWGASASPIVPSAAAPVNSSTMSPSSSRIRAPSEHKHQHHQQQPVARIDQYEHLFRGARVPALNQPGIAYSQVAEIGAHQSATRSRGGFATAKTVPTSTTLLLQPASNSNKNNTTAAAVASKNSATSGFAGITQQTPFAAALAGRNLPNKRPEENKSSNEKGTVNDNNNNNISAAATVASSNLDDGGNNKTSDQEQQHRLTGTALAAAALSRMEKEQNSNNPLLNSFLGDLHYNQHHLSQQQQQKQQHPQHHGGVVPSSARSISSSGVSVSSASQNLLDTARPSLAGEGSSARGVRPFATTTTPSRKHKGGSGGLAFGSSPANDNNDNRPISLEALYGGGRPVSPPKKVVVHASSSSSRSRSRSPTVSDHFQQQQQQHGGTAAAPSSITGALPPLYYASSEEAKTASAAVTAASKLFIRSVGDFENQTSALQSQSQVHQNINASLLSQNTTVRKSSHAEFAGLLQKCEDLWAALGTSVSSREKVTTTLFPMLFQVSSSSSSSHHYNTTQLASFRQTIHKYLQRLETQLELTTAANGACQARDSVVFDIVAISKRYTDYVKNSFDHAGQWKDEAKKYQQQNSTAMLYSERKKENDASAAACEATAIKHELRVAFHKYRLATLVAIESIAKWMEFTGRVDFWWRNRPALLQMCVDLHQAAFSRRPLLYLLGFDVVHNPFVLPGEKWYVVPKRDRWLQQVPSSSSGRHHHRGNSPYVVGVEEQQQQQQQHRGRSSSSKDRRASSSSKREGSWGSAQQHRAISVVDPRSRAGESQNFILMNEVGLPLRQQPKVILSSTKAESLLSAAESPQQHHHQRSPTFSPPTGGRASSSAASSSAQPIPLTAVAPFWRQMEAEEFEYRGRFESAIVLLRHATLQCIVPIQAAIRGYLARKKFKSDMEKIKLLQHHIKVFAFRQDVRRTRRLAASIILADAFRGYVVRFVMFRYRTNAIRIQRRWRGYRCRCWLEERHFAVTRIANWARPIVRRVINQRKRTTRRIKIIQQACRGYLSRKSLCAWAWTRIVTKHRQVKQLVHIEGECRCAIQVDYMLHALGYTASVPVLLRSDEVKTLPQVLRPSLGPLAAWSQLMLHQHMDTFLPHYFRTMVLELVEEQSRVHKQVQAEESLERATVLRPSQMLLQRAMLEQRCVTERLVQVDEFLEPASRYIIGDAFRRERYQLRLHFEALAKLAEVENLESMRRKLMMQAEHDVRLKGGLSPVATYLPCDLLEQEARRKIVSDSTETFVFHFLAMLPDFEALAREKLVLKWREIVGFFSSDVGMKFRQVGGKYPTRFRAGGDNLPHELFALSPTRGGGEFDDSATTTMRIAFQIELLHLSSEEQVARDRIEEQLLHAPVWSHANNYGRLLRSIFRQVAVLYDAEAYAWVKLMSWDGTTPQQTALLPSNSTEAHRQQQQQQQASVNDNNNGDDDETVRANLIPEAANGDVLGTTPVRAWEPQQQQQQRQRGSRFVPNFTKTTAGATTPTPSKRAAIHDFALQHSRQRDINNNNNRAGAENADGLAAVALFSPSNAGAAALTSSYDHQFSLTDVSLASANPVLFRALISHALRLQRIGRAFLERSNLMCLLHLESESRKQIFFESVAELYPLIELIKRDKMVIHEDAQRVKKTNHIRLALGLIEALLKKRDAYRLKRMASKVILYPVLARKYNARLSEKFQIEHNRLFDEESRKRDHTFSTEEPTERQVLLHQYLVSAESAMTITIRRRWNEHQEMIASQRESELTHVRREQVLQDKIYELLMANESQKTEAEMATNRALAKEIAHTERVKELMWGVVQTEQHLAENERALFVTERAARSLVIDQEQAARAAIGRDSAQSVFLDVCSTSPPRGVPPPLHLIRNKKAGMTMMPYSSALTDDPVNVMGAAIRSQQRDFDVLPPQSVFPQQYHTPQHHQHQQQTYQMQQQQQNRQRLAREALRPALEAQPLLSPPPAPQQHAPMTMTADQRAELARSEDEHANEQVRKITFEAVPSWQKDLPTSSSSSSSQHQQQQQQPPALQTEIVADSLDVTPINPPSPVDLGATSPPQPAQDEMQQQRGSASASPPGGNHGDDDDLFGISGSGNNNMDGNLNDLWAQHDNVCKTSSSSSLLLPAQQQQQQQQQSPSAVAGVPSAATEPRRSETPQNHRAVEVPRAVEIPKSLGDIAAATLSSPSRDPAPTVVARSASAPPPADAVVVEVPPSSPSPTAPPPPPPPTQLFFTGNVAKRSPTPPAANSNNSSSPSPDPAHIARGEAVVSADGFAPRGVSSQSSAASASSSTSRGRVVKKKVAVLRHYPMTSQKFSSLPRSSSSIDHDDDNNNNNNNNTNDGGGGGEQQQVQQDHYKSSTPRASSSSRQQQPDMILHPTADGVMVASARRGRAGSMELVPTTVSQHLDSVRGVADNTTDDFMQLHQTTASGRRRGAALGGGASSSTSASSSTAAAGVPVRGALRPSSAGAVRSGSNDQSSSAAAVVPAAHTPPPMAGKASATQNQSLMSMFQEERQQQPTTTSSATQHNTSSATTSTLKKTMMMTPGRGQVVTGSASARANNSTTSTARKSVKFGGLPLSGSAPSSQQQQDDSMMAARKHAQQQNLSLAAMASTAHAASRANIDSDVPEKLEKLAAFADRIESSIAQSSTRRGAGGSIPRSSSCRSGGAAASPMGGRPSLLKRASEVLSEEELAMLSTTTTTTPDASGIVATAEADHDDEYLSQHQYHQEKGVSPKRRRQQQQRNVLDDTMEMQQREIERHHQALAQQIAMNNSRGSLPPPPPPPPPSAEDVDAAYNNIMRLDAPIGAAARRYHDDVVDPDDVDDGVGHYDAAHRENYRHMRSPNLKSPITPLEETADSDRHHQSQQPHNKLLTPLTTNEVEHKKVDSMKRQVLLQAIEHGKKQAVESGTVDGDADASTAQSKLMSPVPTASTHPRAPSASSFAAVPAAGAGTAAPTTTTAVATPRFLLRRAYEVLNSSSPDYDDDDDDNAYYNNNKNDRNLANLEAAISSTHMNMLRSPPHAHQPMSAAAGGNNSSSNSSMLQRQQQSATAARQKKQVTLVVPGDDDGRNMRRGGGGVSSSSSSTTSPSPPRILLEPPSVSRSASDAAAAAASSGGDGRNDTTMNSSRASGGGGGAHDDSSSMLSASYKPDLPWKTYF